MWELRVKTEMGIVKSEATTQVYRSRLEAQVASKYLCQELRAQGHVVEKIEVIKCTSYHEDD